MISIYQRALGADFARLHPKIQERFGFSEADRVASIGRGVMDEIWHGAPFVLPFLQLGAWRRIMFPEQGRGVPFTVENYAYTDRFGRETVSWIRKFRTPRPRRFDAYMVYSDRRGCIVDYLGTHQHLAVDLSLSVDDRGGLRLRSGEQRFYERIVGFRFPLAFSGVADVCEWFDDASQKYRIEVNVTNSRFGKLFGYRGSFDVEWRSVCNDQIPSCLMPTREERRE
ncbi:MAG TPA: DUF4166 domain-containing protein [Pirellulales bacterium]|nr:DUF4166 domain-containing protein [Pirellulales bacterium]